MSRNHSETVIYFVHIFGSH